MSEVNSRRTVVQNLTAVGAHCQRIEDSCSVGIPDLNFCFQCVEVWVEFKYVDRLPKRDTTPIRIGLKPEQALWLNQRAAVGGRVAVLTRMDTPQFNGWLLHTEGIFNGLRDGLTFDILCTTSVMFWEGDFKPRLPQVVRVLTGLNGLHGKIYIDPIESLITG